MYMNTRLPILISRIYVCYTTCNVFEKFMSMRKQEKQPWTKIVLMTYEKNRNLMLQMNLFSWWAWLSWRPRNSILSLWKWDVNKQGALIKGELSGIWCQKVKDIFLLMEIQIKSGADPEISERGGRDPLHPFHHEWKRHMSGHAAIK